MSVLDPNIEVNDEIIDKIMWTDFNRGLEIITLKTKLQLNELFVGKPLVANIQRRLVDIAQDSFFEFSVHWELEYRIHCIPIVDPVTLQPKYVITIHLRVNYISLIISTR